MSQDLVEKFEAGNFKENKEKSSIHLKSSEVDSIELVAINWICSRPVTVLINFEFEKPLTKLKRWDRKTLGKEIKVGCPLAISTYSKSMEVLIWGRMQRDCKGLPKFICGKCKLNLCFTPRAAFFLNECATLKCIKLLSNLC